MRIGILSDSHGRTRIVKRAVAVLREAGARRLVHCGDVGNDDIIAELSILPAVFVWGNTDQPTTQSWEFAARLGVFVPPAPPVELKVADKRVVVFHGHEPAFQSLVNRLSERKIADEDAPHYLLHGHTHVACDTRVGPTRVINPGALHRAATHTVALLDAEQDHLQFFCVRDDGAPKTALEPISLPL